MRLANSAPSPPRWRRGVVYPESWSRARGGGDPCSARAECLLEAGPEASIEVELRFLQVVERQLARVRAGGLEPADELEGDARPIRSGDELVERELRSPPLPPASLERPRLVPIRVAAGGDEELVGAESDPSGAIFRSWEALRGALELRAERLERQLFRLRVVVSNATPGPADRRGAVIRRTLVSPCLIVRGLGARFVSRSRPPRELRARAGACESVELSPVLLPHAPGIASESPGDLFDSSEIAPHPLWKRAGLSGTTGVE